MPKIVTTGPVVIQGKIYAKNKEVDVPDELAGHLIKAGYALRKDQARPKAAQSDASGKKKAAKKTRDQKAYQIQ